MSEYWKSTPKYWCKYCKTFVRDTKFAKEQHDVTPKHQGNIQRSLRNLHRDNEREEREKQRAKDEVARLNGIVSGKSGESQQHGTSSKSPASSSTLKTATLEDRKRQMAQLAALGVAVPDEYRREVAMAGDWQTVALKPAIKAEEDTKLDVKNIGVLKRKHEDGESDDAQGPTRRKQWGSEFKSYSDVKEEEESVDIEALLLPKETQSQDAPAIKTEEAIVKQEKDDDIELERQPLTESDNANPSTLIADVKTEPEAPVFFKKRKPRAINGG